MSINQVTPGQGWLETLNNDLTNLDGSVIQRTDWQLANAIFINGFNSPSDDEYAKVAVRYLKNNRGAILGTEIFGTTSKAKYDGTATDFCTITGVPLSGRSVTGSAQPAVYNDSTGIATVQISKEDYQKHVLTLKIIGHRYDNNYPWMDGWIAFHLIY